MSPHLPTNSRHPRASCRTALKLGMAELITKALADATLADAEDDDSGPPPLVAAPPSHGVVAPTAAGTSSTGILSIPGIGDFTTDFPAVEPEPDLSRMSDLEVIRYVQLQEQKKLLEKRAAKDAKKGKSAEEAEHKFWDTQPMLSFNSAPVDPTANGPIDSTEDVATVRAEPFGMPAGFSWSELDILNPAVGAELYTLLSKNYVEDDEAMFRFDYSTEFLQWALTPPGYLPELHLGVRATASGKLLGVITAIPAVMCVNGIDRHMVEINFLCVHKKLRTQRLAPVLIMEVRVC